MTSAGRTRVMLVNRQSLMRELLRDVLEVTGEFEVVGLAADGREALGMVEETLPELVVMDLALPVMDGIAACREIRTLFPDVRVLMLAASVDQECLVGAVAAGATGYLQRCSGKEQLLATVREVVRGEFRIPGSAAGLLAGALRTVAPRGALELLEVLTGREREMLRLFLGGMTYEQIGEARNVRAVTVRNAVSGAQRKLGFRTRHQMVLWAVRAGLVDGGSE